MHLNLLSQYFNNLPEASVTAGSAAFVTEVRKHQANVQSWVGSQFHLWLRHMGAVYRGQVGSCLSFGHAAQLLKIHSNCILLWTTERDPNVRTCSQDSPRTSLTELSYIFG